MLVAAIKQYFKELRANPQPPPFPTSASPTAAAPISGDITTDALEWRDVLRSFESADTDSRETMEMQASLRAENIEESHGLDAALKWHKAAATTSETLTELQGKLLTAVDYKASTKDGHRKALRELLAYLKNPEASPKDVTLSVANVFIDQWITQQGYAYNTIGDRLACLSVL